MPKSYRMGIVIRIAVVAIAGWVGCATVRETARSGREVQGGEEEVVCSGACEEEWRRAEEWVKKHSGYAFPAGVIVTPDRIEAGRLPSERSRAPLASEPLGLGDRDPNSMLPKRLPSEGGRNWTFLVLRRAEGDGSSRIRLVQHCWSRGGPGACDAPGIRRNRQDRFRRFVRTGELPPP